MQLEDYLHDDEQKVGELSGKEYDYALTTSRVIRRKSSRRRDDETFHDMAIDEISATGYAQTEESNDLINLSLVGIVIVVVGAAGLVIPQVPMAFAVGGVVGGLTMAILGIVMNQSWIEAECYLYCKGIDTRWPINVDDDVEHTEVVRFVKTLRELQERRRP